MQQTPQSSTGKKTVIITGANGNLGTAVTKEFLGKGYKVIAVVNNAAEKNELPPHANLHTQAVNLADETESTFFVQLVLQKYKTIDAALLLVGGFDTGNIAATTGAAIKEQFSLNFETAYYISRPLFQHMLNTNNGRLVFIGARPAIDAASGKNLIAYSLAKSLLFKLAEFMNEEAKGKNVAAAVVVPSTLDTPSNRKYMPDINPAKWVKPEDFAGILEFIISEKGHSLRETVLKVYNNS
jgi:NAD(P)-dependent dehydrogenase (short-subunit alcohol dehydrogenase family)